MLHTFLLCFYQYNVSSLVKDKGNYNDLIVSTESRSWKQKVLGIEVISVFFFPLTGYCIYINLICIL
jgi:hypothetical protein